MLTGVGKTAMSTGRKLGRRGWGLLIATALALGGCAAEQPEVKVIRSRSDATPMDRVYILVFQGQLDRDHADRDWNRANEVRQALAEAFQSRVAALATMVATGLELEKGPARADIDAFHPDGVLVIKPAAGVVTQPDAPPQVTYDVALLEPKLERTTWRAMLVSEAGPQTMARDLVRNLAWEGLLHRKPGDEPGAAKEAPAK